MREAADKSELLAKTKMELAYSAAQATDEARKCGEFTWPSGARLEQGEECSRRCAMRRAIAIHRARKKLRQQSQGREQLLRTRSGEETERRDER